jgi:hypothetical protein
MTYHRVVVIVLAVTSMVAVSQLSNPGPAGASDPSGFVQGDVDCNGQVETLDALHVVRQSAGIAGAPTSAPCPALGVTQIGDFAWGDTDCSNSIGVGDALAILRHVGGIGPAAAAGACTATGVIVGGGEAVECDAIGWTVAAGDGDWECQSPTSARLSVTSGEHMVLSSESFTDTFIGADVSTLNREASLVLRAQDGDNAYVVVFIPDGTPFASGVQFYRKIGGAYQILANEPLPSPIQTGEGARLEAMMVGDLMEVSLNGVQLISMTDSTFASGRVGLRTFADATGPADSFWENVTFGEVQ